MSAELPNWRVMTVEEVMRKVSDANQELWDNAVLAISGIGLSRCDNGRMTPVMNAKPLADLLRSDALMPASARYAIAEFLDPGEHTSTNMKLVPTQINTPLKESELFNRQLPAVLEFERLRREGVGSDDAKYKAGQKFDFDRDERHFRRVRVKILSWLKWLRT